MTNWQTISSEEMEKLDIPPEWIQLFHQNLVERDNYQKLRRLETRVRAIVAYYDDEDLAAHLTAAMDGGETYSTEGVVRKVWINHKLVETFRELREQLGLSAR